MRRAFQTKSHIRETQLNNTNTEEVIVVGNYKRMLDSFLTVSADISSRTRQNFVLNE